jgi:hypothetical protein
MVPCFRRLQTFLIHVSFLRLVQKTHKITGLWNCLMKVTCKVRDVDVLIYQATFKLSTPTSVLVLIIALVHRNIAFLGILQLLHLSPDAPWLRAIKMCMHNSRITHTHIKKTNIKAIVRVRPHSAHIVSLLFF